MADAITRKLLAAYKDSDMARPVGFLTSLTTPVYHNSEKVAWDVQRSGQLVAPAIALGTSNLTKADLWSAKEESPFYYNQKGNLNAFELLGRDPGETNFADTNFQVKTASKAIALGISNFDTVARSVELQVSQVLTTGTITAGGVTVSFSPKAAHFPTVGTAWTNAASDILGDILSLCKVINTNGKKRPTDIIFSDGDFTSFMNNTAVKAQLDNRRINISQVESVVPVGGAYYHGTLSVGAFKLNMWTYDDTYQLTEGGAYKDFIPANKTIITARGRINSTFGGIPRVVPKDSRLAFIPDRFNVPGQFLDMSIFPSVSANGQTLSIEVGTRALVVPVAIDTFGCITTTP